MNIITGLTMSGTKLNTQDNYNSISGLKLWVDGRQRVTKNGTNEISLWGDKSSEGNNLFQNKANQKPFSDRSIWVDSSPNIVPSMSLISNRKDYRFLHNGSPFAVYSIIKVNLASLLNAGTIINTHTSNQNGLSFLMNAANNGRVVITAYSGGVLKRQPLLINIRNSHPGLGIYIVKYVYKGTGVAGNNIIRFGNATTTVTTAAGGYSSNDNDNFLVCGNSTIGQTIKMGLTLVYDWTGQAPAQIDSFDSRIMAQLNEDKILFEILDAA